MKLFIMQNDMNDYDTANQGGANERNALASKRRTTVNEK
jgi:hypothetical protein